MTPQQIINSEPVHTARFQFARKIHLHNVKQRRLEVELIADDSKNIKSSIPEIPDISVKSNRKSWGKLYD